MLNILLGLSFLLFADLRLQMRRSRSAISFGE
jgi:hypothetical protein